MATVTKPNTFTAGALIIASEHNANFDTIYNEFNGSISNANISASAAIVDSKLATITTTGKVDFSALTIASQAQGDVAFRSASAWTRLAADTAGRPLITNGASADPSFSNVGGTPGLTLGTTNSAGSAETYIRTDDTVLAFDATVPVTQAHDDSAATGSATVAARRDHVHGMPAGGGAWIFVETLTLTGSSVTSATLPTDSDLFMVAIADADGFLKFRFNGDSTATYEYVDRTGVTWTRTTGATSIFLQQSGGYDVNGVLIFGRLAQLGGHSLSIDLIRGGTLGNSSFYDGSWTNTGAITTINFSGSTMSGKAHLYKLGVQ